MNNLLVLPLLIPLCTAVILLFFNKQIAWQRWISTISVLLNLTVSSVILFQVKIEGIQTLYMGGWLPPYGIVFVADMLAALMVLATSVVGACCLFFAFGTIGKEREKYYFYPFFNFCLWG